MVWIIKRVRKKENKHQEKFAEKLLSVLSSQIYVYKSVINNKIFLILFKLSNIVF